MICTKCNKEFSSERYLKQHNSQNPNCVIKCEKCLKTFSSKQALRNHNKKKCKPLYKCTKCNKTYQSKYDCDYHRCQIDNTNNSMIPDNVQDIIANIPDNSNDKIQINIYNINSNNNNNNNINQVTNKFKVKQNFLETKPISLDSGYDEDNYKYLSEYNEHIEEKYADLYMNEEAKLKLEHKEMYDKFENDKLQLKGFQLLHTELQKNPKYRNVRIKKSKSGKCHVYTRNGWVEMSLQKGITKVCSKLCNSMYDKGSNVNYYLNLVISSQKKRIMELRKHIERNILNLNNIEEENQIENLIPS